MRTETEQELKALIDQWDPIGLLGMDAAKNEYECLVPEVLSRLHRGSSAADLST